MYHLQLNKKLSLLAVLELFSFNSMAGVTNKQSTDPIWEKDKPYRFTILHTNDHHVHFWQNDIEDVKINNQPIDLKKSYSIATLDFLAAGGDGYLITNTVSTYVDTGYRDADSVKLYFDTHSPINATDYQPTQFILDK